MAGLWPAGWAPGPTAPAAAPTARPLILTLALPDGLQRQADALRGARVPDAARAAPAHLSLFRHLPGLEAEALSRTLKGCCAAAAPVFRLGPPVRWDGLWVAPVDVPDLDALREELAQRWHGLLVPGDHAPPRLHISLGKGSGAPPALPEGPWRARGLLLWQHCAGPPDAAGQRGGLHSAAFRGGPHSAAFRGGSHSAAFRGGPFWRPLVAFAFRG